MDNAFEPGLEHDAEPIPLMLATQVTMGIVGLFYLLFALLGVAMMVFGAMMLAGDAGEDAIILLIEGPILLVFSGGLGSIIVAAAMGLQRRAMWAWVATLVAGAMMLSSPCCLPVGALWLYTMLQEPARKAFLE